MAERSLTRAVRSWVRMPVAARIGVIYALSRLVTTALLALAAAQSTSLSRFGADASVAEFVIGWDAQWYWTVAEYGYPAELPRTDTGEVAENAWAFMPVYAHVAKLVGFGFWPSGALVVSLVAGFLACLALHRLLRDRIGASAAMWAVAFFSCGPLAALFQVGYAEALFVLLLLVALDLVSRHRYAWLYALIPVMGFTRPGILAFALFLGLHGLSRWVRRRVEPLGGREAAHIVALGALATAVGFSWQLIATVVTGEWDAYLQTELAWRRNWIPDASAEFVPFDGFLRAAVFWFSHWGMPGWWGPIALAVLVAGAAFLLMRVRAVRRLGVDIRLWSASYLLYLLAVFFPQSSLFRLLLPVSPLWGAVAVPRSRLWRVGVLVACVLGQWVWIHHMYGLGNTYWQVP